MITRRQVNQGRQAPIARAVAHSSGKWLVRSRPGASGKARLTWAGVGLACAAALGVAWFLTPDRRGYGTHEQLGGYPCSFVLTTGLPCPTCGMTTAFALMMHGRPLTAFEVQPAGAVLCWATIVLLAGSIWVVVCGRAITVNWEWIGPVRLMLGVGLLILGAWAFKIAQGLATGGMPAR